MSDVRLVDIQACKFKEELAVFCLQVSDFEQNLTHLKKLLNESEVLKSDNFVMEKDRKRFIVTRGVLKIILGKFLNKNPEDIEFYFEQHLKPRVKTQHSNLHFNVTHSADRIIIAISSKPIGVDIEHVDEEFGFDQILDVTFSDNELDYIQNSNNKSEAFYLLWTRKEAFLKATGKGIDDDLQQIPALTGIHELVSEISDSETPWFVGSFGIGNSYIASLSFSPELLKGPINLYSTGPEILMV
ncbi:MAG: 4'-phosphopantetheinyl transferase superfamily protein [Bacteroidia bacterium]